MKLLIAYDGSACSEAALDDLPRAGLPEQAEALVLTVSEVSLPKDEAFNVFSDESEAQNKAFSEKTGGSGAERLSEAKAFARHAQKRLKIHFPNWTIAARTAFGSPAREIIVNANRMNADLIVVGSHGHNFSLGGRFSLGSVSQKVLTEAECSVRVSRGRVEVDPVPSLVLIAYDGMTGANAAVEAVIARNWRDASDFRLVTVGDQVAPAAIERFVPAVARWIEDEIKTESESIEKLTAPALEKLRRAGLTAALDICAGNPKQILVEEAARLNADCIFVGAQSRAGSIGRFLLGSVAYSVAARAHCSVEVVRKKSSES